MNKKFLIPLCAALTLITMPTAAMAGGNHDGPDRPVWSPPDRPDRPDFPNRPDRPPVNFPDRPDRPTEPPVTPPTEGREYPWHTNIVATTFWVGEIFDPDAADGSQMLSTYDEDWYAHYGGCDGVETRNTCNTERRTASNGYFPTEMTPRENPFYLDVPFDDINNPRAFRMRGDVIPWANDPGYRGHENDRNFSYLKNRWIQVVGPNGNTCYGQIEDAGPGRYADAEYTFGDNDARPQNRRYGRAGMDVSPALNGCLGFDELNGQSDRIDWKFVDDVDVPDGPWTRLVTDSPVNNG